MSNFLCAFFFLSIVCCTTESTQKNSVEAENLIGEAYALGRSGFAIKETLTKLISLLDTSEDRGVAGSFYLAAGQLYHDHHMYSDALSPLEMACEISKGFPDAEIGESCEEWANALLSAKEYSTPHN